ncbi:MAG: radical SAM protein [Desulfomonilaceae bacterium]
MNITVCEIFKSIQGESSYAGIPFTIIRLAGCNLRCSYCDTSYAWEGGEEISVDKVLQTALDFNLKRVLVTGGEPLIQPASSKLVRLLCKSGRKVLVETNGSMDISVLPRGVVAVMDIKCPGSGQSHMMNWNNLNKLRPYDQVKFVLLDRQDYEFARKIYRKHLVNTRNEVLMSAGAGELDPRHLAEWMLSDNLEVRLQLQLHKQIWPDQLRGV